MASSGRWTKLLLSAALLIVFSVMMGSYGSKANAPYREAQSLPVWSEAKWIAPPGPDVVAYYRYTFLVTSATKGYLQLSAPDSLDVYVNGEKITSRTYESTIAATAIDLGPYLVRGKNSLAILVQRMTYPGRPQLIAEGYWTDVGGVTSNIVTNGRWRVSSRPNTQANGTIQWHDTEFNDVDWPRALETQGERGAVVSPLPAPPLLFERFPRGHWMWNQDEGATRATFRRSLTLPPQAVNNAWIGISSNSDYILNINQTIVYQGTPTRDYMDAMAIGPYLRWGRNDIVIEATAIVRGARMAVSGIVDAAGEQLDFSSNEVWQSAARSSDDGKEVWTSPAIFGAMLPVSIRQTQVETGLPTLRVIESFALEGSVKSKVMNAALWSMGALAANLLAALIFVFLWKRFWTTANDSALEVFTKPYVMGVLVLGFVVLDSYDVRVDDADLYTPWLFFAIWIATLIVQAMSLAEAYLRSSGWAARLSNEN